MRTNRRENKSARLQAYEVRVGDKIYYLLRLAMNVLTLFRSSCKENVVNTRSPGVSYLEFKEQMRMRIERSIPSRYKFGNVPTYLYAIVEVAAWHASASTYDAPGGVELCDIDRLDAKVFT